MTYLPTWVQESGGPLAAGARMLFALTVGTGVGSLIGGTLADRMGRWQLMALALGLLGPAGWLLLHAPAPWQMLLAGLVGALIGADYPAAIVAAQETWPGGLGVATGLALGLSWIGAGVGGLVTGLLADHYSVALALRWLVVPAVLSCLCVLAYPLVMRRRE
jgi:FSR family fosmidomycin resistance protein-like MFS transporter